MVRLTTTWLACNTLRLAGVTALLWTLIVQILEVAHDVKQDAAKNNAMHQILSPSNPVPALNASRVSTAVNTATAASSALTTFIPIMKSALPDPSAVILNIKRDTVEETSIPVQTGGLTFDIISRVVIAGVVCLLISGQLGVPEMLLHDYIPWLGPQSTPIWLGMIQVIIAIENLRVYAEPTMLLPAWFLLGVGAANSILGIVLLVLGRRLPKTPAPALYFSLSQRMIFISAPPPCYQVLITNAQPPLQSTVADRKLEEGIISNAQEIGLEAFDSEEEKETVPNPVQTKQADITQGGYPTFSGGGLADPGKQVPVGVLADNAKGVRFLPTNVVQAIKAGREGGTALAPSTMDRDPSHSSRASAQFPLPPARESTPSTPPLQNTLKTSAAATVSGESSPPKSLNTVAILQRDRERTAARRATTLPAPSLEQTPPATPKTKRLTTLSDVRNRRATRGVRLDLEAVPELPDTPAGIEKARRTKAKSDTSETTASKKEYGGGKAKKHDVENVRESEKSKGNPSRTGHKEGAEKATKRSNSARRPRTEAETEDRKRRKERPTSIA